MNSMVNRNGDPCPDTRLTFTLANVIDFDDAVDKSREILDHTVGENAYLIKEMHFTFIGAPRANASNWNVAVAAERIPTIPF